MGENNVIAIICARGGSQGVKRKNIRMFGNHPLIAWTIHAARGARCVDDVYVTTEDAEIGNISMQYGAKVLPRPAGLAEGHVQTSEVFLFALRQLNTDRNIHPKTLILMQPTNPFRTAKHIDEAHEMFGGEGSIIGAVPNKKYHWGFDEDENVAIPVDNDPMHRVGRQWRGENSWLKEETGSLYVVSAEEFSTWRDYHLSPFSLYLMPPEANLELDTEYDFWLAEQWIKYHGIQGPEGLCPAQTQGE